MADDSPSFTWRPIYREIADRLSDFADRDGELADLMVRMNEKGLVTCRVRDEDAAGRTIALSEVDPFTFMANYNRNITHENRVAILRHLRREWSLSSDVPRDFLGLPVMNLQSSWFIPFRYERDADHIPTLWRFHRHALSIDSADDLDVELFDRCCSFKQVAAASLTMALFWMRPETWTACDRKNRSLAATRGIEARVRTGAEYVRWLRQVRNAFDHDDGVQFSRRAHLHDKEPRPDIAAAHRPADSPDDRRYWIIAPDKDAILWDAWCEDGVASIGWNDVGDLNLLEREDDVVDSVRRYYPESGIQWVGGMLWRFANEMSPGDIVIAKRGRFGTVGWGVVQGNYEFREDAEGDEAHVHRRRVDWRSQKSVTLPDGVFLPVKALTEASPETKSWTHLQAAYPAAFDDAPERSSVDEPEPPPPYELDDAARGLFLSRERLIGLVSLARRKKNLILQGPPGTGKTFLAKRLASLLTGEEKTPRIEVTQFHQSSSYEDFIEGFRPRIAAGTDAGPVGFDLVRGLFQRFCRTAMTETGKVFVMIIDEINRGNLSKVFGELMLLIEPDKRGPTFAMPLTYSSTSDDNFYVPKNVHLIGTMNTADRSLATIDYALRRRFAFVDLEPEFDSATFESTLVEGGVSSANVLVIRKTMAALNRMIAADADLGPGFRIGHSFFVPDDRIASEDEWLDQVMRYEIRPLLHEYFCDDRDRLGKALSLLPDSTS